MTLIVKSTIIRSLTHGRLKGTRALLAANGGQSDRSRARSVHSQSLCAVFCRNAFRHWRSVLGFTFPPLMIAVAEHPWITLILMLGGVMAAQAVRTCPA